jgi:oxygen-independent coproporphyrinogen-3 oxidase
MVGANREGAGSRMLRQQTLGLYVHLPWCARKCPYCDFNSHALRGGLPESRYLRALLLDLAHEHEQAPFAGIRSVFFGGGTPSLFSAAAIGSLLRWLRQRGLLAADAEITLEANPGAVERGSFEAYRAAGVNRLSLGAQSFSDDSLRSLGRIHSSSEVWKSVQEIKSAGFEQFNLDLMYGLPGQSPEDAVRDVELALTAEPTHISHYQLTLEPNTLFYVRPPPLPSDDAIWKAHRAADRILVAAGFQRYEVSAYALVNAECRHNLNYWRFGDYIGVGAGAHGKRTFAAEGRIVRTRRTRHPEAFMTYQPSIEETHEIKGRDRAFEFMINALRLTAGFDELLFESATGLRAEAIRQQLEEAEDRGLLERTAGSGWRPTPLGQRFLNDLQAMFLPDPVD